MVTVYSENSNKLSISLKEVLRYMGCTADADTETLNLAKAVIEEISGLITLKACYDKYPVKIIDDVIDFGFKAVKSKDLSKNLKGCSKVFLFVATIGIETDRKINKYSISEPSKALAYQSVGAAAIEGWCDMLCHHFKEKTKEICPRFSAGYGDLPLDFQKDIFSVLDATRKTGVSLTDSMLMIPTKSVSAIVGIKQ